MKLVSPLRGVDPIALCAEISCEKFPDGYLVADLMGGRYYFPLSQKVMRFLPRHAQISSKVTRKKIWLEGRNPNGDLSFSYIRAPKWIVFTTGSNIAFANWFLGARVPLRESVLWNGGFVLHADYGTIGASLSWQLFGERRLMPDLMSVEDLTPEQVESEMAGYLKLKTRDKYNHHLFVSKEPFWNGRHILATCRKYCRIMPLVSPSDRNEPVLGLTIGFDYRSRHRLECTGALRSSERKCTRDWSFILGAQAVLGAMIDTLEAAKIVPSID